MKKSQQKPKTQKQKKTSKQKKGRVAATTLVIAPRVRPTGNRLPGTYVVKHRELVASVTSASAVWAPLGSSGSIPGYDFNPATSTCFPWLSQQAVGYEKYKFHALSFEFIPGNPSTTGGRIHAFVDYDYDDPVPTSLSAMSASYGIVSNDVWQTFKVNVDVRRMNEILPYRYINRTTRDVEVEARTIYGGQLFAAVTGLTATCTWDLFVDYTVEFSTPQNPLTPIPTPIEQLTFPLNVTHVYKSVNVPLSSAYVVPGVDGAPAMITGGGHSFAGSRVLLLDQYRDGKITLQGNVSGNVGTPANNVPNCAQEGAIFSNTGAHLGYLSAIVAGSAFRAQSSTQWSTPAAILEGTWTFLVRWIRNTYPTATQLGWILYNGAAKSGEIANVFDGVFSASKVEL